MKRFTLILAALAVATPAFLTAQASNDLQKEMDALSMQMDMQGRQGAGPGQAGASTYTAPPNANLPPADPYVADALKNSPRHGEWDDIKGPDGKMIKAWVVYPRSTEKTGVVIVIHEIFGMTDWVRGVADQVAADGFIAIAPDMVSNMGPNGGGSEDLGSSGVGRAIQSLTPERRAEILNAAMAYGKSMPSSNGKTGVVGFCWGGGTSLLYAIAQPSLSAAVMFYGPAPTKPGTQEVDLSGLPNIKAPILALYPGTDARTSSTAEPISNEMKRLGKPFEYHIYDGATHGFMHQRIAPDTKAAQESWPLVVDIFQKNLK
jgi:carboxymethylenebutenolidase